MVILKLFLPACGAKQKFILVFSAPRLLSINSVLAKGKNYAAQLHLAWNDAG